MISGACHESNVLHSARPSCLFARFTGRRADPQSQIPGRARAGGRFGRTIDLADFSKPMSLEEALSVLQAKLKSKGKDLPVRINHEAFEEENPDAEKVIDTQKKTLFLLKPGARTLPSMVAVPLPFVDFRKPTPKVSSLAGDRNRSTPKGWPFPMFGTTPFVTGSLGWAPAIWL
jgi:hypothetical protein